MIRFRLFGFPVTVEPWHWAILAFLGGALSVRDSEQLLPVLLFMVAGFVSVLIHELGHALTMRLFGCRHIAIVLNGFGGIAVSKGARFTRGQQILVSLAGPFLQAACGLLVLAAVIIGDEVGWTGGTVGLMSGFFIYVSLAWAILNLIPVYPLDGGQALNGVLGPLRIELTLRISMIAAIVAGAGIFFVFKSPLFPMFMVFFAIENYKALKRVQSPSGPW